MSNRAVPLVVIDMQSGLDDPQYGERSTPLCDANIQTLLQAWRQSLQPVLFTRHISQRQGSPLGRSSRGTAIKPEVAPRSAEPVFEKSTNSAFKNSAFSQALAATNPKAIVFVGMATDACVTATVREAKDLGYSTVVVAEACATFARSSISGSSLSAQTVHEVSLASLAASGIQVCTVGEAVGLVAC